MSLVVLQEIKKKKGIKDEVQLTSKQKEMMQNQLEKEAAIRKRLQGVRTSSDLIFKVCGAVCWIQCLLNL